MPHVCLDLQFITNTSWNEMILHDVLRRFSDGSFCVSFCFLQTLEDLSSSGTSGGGGGGGGGCCCDEFTL